MKTQNGSNQSAYDAFYKLAEVTIALLCPHDCRLVTGTAFR